MVSLICPAIPLIALTEVVTGQLTADHTASLVVLQLGPWCSGQMGLSSGVCHPYDGACVRTSLRGRKSDRLEFSKEHPVTLFQTASFSWKHMLLPPGHVFFFFFLDVLSAVGTDFFHLKFVPHNSILREMKTRALFVEVPETAEGRDSERSPLLLK